MERGLLAVTRNGEGGHFYSVPPGRLVTQRDGTMVARDESGSAHWSVDALAQAAKEAASA
ncbi:MAG TPA: hypothetical protein VF844_17015 [Ktedonobacteraceae bacterium]